QRFIVLGVQVTHELALSLSQLDTGLALARLRLTQLASKTSPVPYRNRQIRGHHVTEIRKNSELGFGGNPAVQRKLVRLDAVDALDRDVREERIPGGPHILSRRTQRFVGGAKIRIAAFRHSLNISKRRKRRCRAQVVNDREIFAERREQKNG